MHSFINPFFSPHFFFPPSVCLYNTSTQLQVAQNTKGEADFANFDAFGNTSGSTGGFPSAPQAPFQPPNTGRASWFYWTNNTTKSIRQRNRFALCTQADM